MNTQNSNIATSCSSRTRLAASLHIGSPLSSVSLALAAWLLACVAGYGQQLLAPAAVPSVITHNPAADSIKPIIPAEKRRPAIIAKSNGGIEISFHDCRENEKEHVSCHFTDNHGEAHWVYLPGVELPK